MARTGTSTVVCLCEPHELVSRYPSYAKWLADNQPARAVWLPIPDLDVPAPDECEPLLGELLRRLGAGERLLMHCGAGIGRSGTVAIALLVTAGVPLATAAATVAAGRPRAGAESQAQADFLAGLAARLAPPSGAPEV